VTPGPGRPARIAAVLAAALGAVLLVVAALLSPPGQPSSTGADRVRDLAAAPAPERGAPHAIGAEAADTRPTRSVPPVAVDIEAIGVNAEVDEVGVDTGTGQMEVPQPADRLGWYRFGPGLDATAGSIVIAGHVDDESGPGAFFRLGDLEPGDSIEVTGVDGETRTFEVVAREVHHKSEVPLQQYFARDGAPRLTLITCGGAFDRDSGQYRDNIVITAVPA
jgi:hypothetical protein